MNDPTPGVDRQLTFPATAGQIMILARALGDTDPAYLDPGSVEARKHGGVIAPPTFTQIRYHYDPDTEIRPRFDRPWYGSGKAPTGTPGRHPEEVRGYALADDELALPAETHFEYHAPIHAGDTITMRERFNSQWEKETSRAGRLRFFDLVREYRNQDGALAVTERIVFFVTNRGVEAG
jgi:acyl dehydratase